ncbi:hypothetical protein [Croceimicrobium hydrocarbonivorans]|uniref:Uncharacterized protein n=1 Tax=Croceimicrobium hydrocarbonivorans TaxID=2761580 RepID=A0A7H0VHH8_9FLAO|nr:hypothetical protein [Croceimicrobium hydrocarbonivorans]QNR25176.1 hypothetical protein H4K34_04875 [Croceimicrobium hydrocarbonivorans]
MKELQEDIDKPLDVKIKYLAISLGILALGILSTALGSLICFVLFSYLSEEDDVFKSSSVYPLTLSTSLVLFIASLLYHFLFFKKKSPEISISAESIIIGKDVLKYRDIKKIYVDYKVPFRYIFNQYVDGITILLRDGSEKIIYPSHYHKPWELKTHLIARKKGKIPRPIHIDRTTKAMIETEVFTYFKGIPMLNFFGLFFWIPISTFTLIFCFSLMDGNFQQASFFFLLKAIWYFLFSIPLHYVGISENFLIIKNHNYPWRFHIYRKNDIKLVILEIVRIPTLYPENKLIRVITKDNREGRFIASLLNEEKWHELKKSLSQNGIAISG